LASTEFSLLDKRKITKLVSATIFAAKQIVRFEAEQHNPHEFLPVDRMTNQAAFIMKRINEKYSRTRSMEKA
jgi:hypothetical protein